MDAVLLLNLYCLHQSPILSSVVAVPITVYIDLASFYYIYSFLASRLQQSLIGQVKCLLQFACDAGLHFLGPSAEKEYAGLHDGQRLLIDDDCPQLLIQFGQQVLLLFRGKFHKCILIGDEVSLGLVD